MEEKELCGSYLCSAVHYRVRGPSLRFMHCHCSRCRKARDTGILTERDLERCLRG